MLCPCVDITEKGDQFYFSLRRGEKPGHAGTFIVRECSIEFSSISIHPREESSRTGIASKQTLQRCKLNLLAELHLLDSRQTAF